ncbi:UNVERIFIED_CONTAM: hypothetical protein PYX00_001089 [Menopon gallinae]
MRFSVICCARKIAPLTLKHSNLPEEFVRRCTEVIEYEAPKLPTHRQVSLKRQKTNFELHKPWSSVFQHSNYPVKKTNKIWVEPIKDWCFFRGDRVEILTGKDKGKQGIITYIVQERNWVIVQGMNMVFSKPRTHPYHYLLKEAPLLVNKQVVLVDPGDLKPTQVEWRYDEEGNRVRVSIRTGRLLPIPEMEEETIDYKTKSSYIERGKDTVDAAMCKVTFVPKLKTFEMDLMDEYGIKEDRIPAKTYWY